MNILMISDVYFPRVNGVSTSIETFRNELMQRDVKVTLIAPAYGKHKEEGGISRIPSKMVMFDPEDRMMRYRSITAMADVLGNQKFDLIHIQTPFVAHYAGIALANELKLPKIVTYHTFFEEYLYHYIPFLPATWMRGLARRFSRKQCNDVDAIVVPSSAMAETLKAYGVEKPLHLIPTGIPEKMFSQGNRDVFRARHGISLERPVLLFVGRVAFEKNIEFLLRAADIARKDIPDLMLVIAGEGPAKHSLEKLLKALHLEQNAKMIGYMDREKQLMDCYSAADAFVFASRTETQGLVLLEAMAAGLPVVSTAFMGTRDILKPDSGALVPEDSLESFAGQMVRVLADSALRRELGRQAHSYARQWSSGAMAEKMMNLYQELITKSST
ncbi:MAG: glycosyltransferase [Burkholderiales bacterium]|nr:glycosyltransferase [Burkholderiales bacterium]